MFLDYPPFLQVGSENLVVTDCIPKFLSTVPPFDWLASQDLSCDMSQSVLLASMKLSRLSSFLKRHFTLFLYYHG
jgi:hypothetical protein